VSEVPSFVPWFPVVGSLVGFLAGVVYWGATTLVDPLWAAFLSVLIGTAITGGFHEDGLGDTFDGLGGGRSVEERLVIMRDSRLGTFGTLAVVGSVVLRASALAVFDPVAGIAVVVLAHTVGRTVSAVAMKALPPANTEGLGSAYLSVLGRRHVMGAGLAGLAITVGVGGLVGIVMMAVGAGGAIVLTWWANRKIGGLTGDVLGGIEQVGEIGALAAAAAVAGGSSIVWFA
jgi:adenosylcobinamide-GDP ribazoletransferase